MTARSSASAAGLQSRGRLSRATAGVGGGGRAAICVGSRCRRQCFLTAATPWGVQPGSASVAAISNQRESGSRHSTAYSGVAASAASRALSRAGVQTVRCAATAASRAARSRASSSSTRPSRADGSATGVARLRKPSRVPGAVVFRPPAVSFIEVSVTSRPVRRSSWLAGLASPHWPRCFWNTNRCTSPGVGARPGAANRASSGSSGPRPEASERWHGATPRCTGQPQRERVPSSTTGPRQRS